MYLKYPELQEYKCSGIYVIENTTNGKKYIGSAVNLRNRIRGHFRKLETGVHGNIKLQRAWDKVGADNFTATVLEFVEKPELLIEREQFFLDTICPEYNICKVAASTLGVPQHPNATAALKAYRDLKIPVSEETRRKLSEASKRNRPKLPKKPYQRKDKKDWIRVYPSELFFQKGAEKLAQMTGKTYEEYYGEEKAAEIKNKMREYFTPEHRLELAEKAKDRFSGKEQTTEHVTNRIAKRCKPIEVFTENGEFVKLFPSIDIAILETGSCFNTIKKAINSGNPTRNKKYIFKYAEDPTIGQELYKLINLK